MLKHFWTLPAVLRVTVAAHSTFNVYSDLLAFPQYEVVFDKSYVPISEADSLLARRHVNDATPLHSNSDDSQSTFDTAGDLSVRSNTAEANNLHPPTNHHDTYERLILNSRPHLCKIPYVAPATDNTTAIPKEEEEEELARAADHGLELLKDMQGQCIYYGAGWWVYSFCYNEGIRQFHPLPAGRGGVPQYPPSEDRTVQSYTLGQFPTISADEQAQRPNTDVSTSSSSSATTSTNLSVTSRADSTFLSQSLTGGTLCDLTSKPRRVDIHYHCNPSTNDRIAMIKETASCVYLMVIHTPRLCNDVVFQPPQIEKPNPIICREIISTEEEEQNWKERTRTQSEKVLKDEILATENKQDLVAPTNVQEMLQQKLQQVIPNQQQQQHPHQQQPLVIGGITVGARQITGNTPIPPSAIILAAQKQQQQQTQNHLSHPNPNTNTNANAANAATTKDTPASSEETYITTLAKSDGRYTSSLTDAEMKKLGLRGTREELEKWVQEMDDLAGVGVPWRLDVVRLGDGGMEFRGIVMEEGKGQASWGRDDGGKDGGGKEKGGGTGGGVEERGDEVVGGGDDGGGGALHEGDEVGSEEEYR